MSTEQNRQEGGLNRMTPARRAQQSIPEDGGAAPWCGGRSSSHSGHIDGRHCQYCMRAGAARARTPERTVFCVVLAAEADPEDPATAGSNEYASSKGVQPGAT